MTASMTSLASSRPAVDEPERCRSLDADDTDTDTSSGRRSRMTTATSIDVIDDRLDTSTVELEMDSRHCTMHHGICRRYSSTCVSSIVVVVVVVTFIHGLAAECLLRCCIPLAAIPGRSQLRSADVRHLLLPRTTTVMLGPRAFYLSGPASWNSLPTELRHPDLTLGTFKCMAVKDSSVYVDAGLWIWSPCALM